MKHHTRVALLAMIAWACSSANALAAPSATATTQASITFSNFTLSAFDLVPGDSFLPSYQILPGAVTSVSAGMWGVPYLPKRAPGFFTPLSSSASFGVPPLGSDQLPQHSSASIGPGGMTLSVSGEGNFFVVGAEAESNPFDVEAFNIRIAPGTGILASGTLQMNASAECDAPVSCGATTSFTASFARGDDDSATYFTRDLTAQPGTSPQAFLGPAGVTYVNFTDHAQNVTLRISSLASVHASVVDEPGLALIVGSGLLATGWVRRRQKPR